MRVLVVAFCATGMIGCLLGAVLEALHGSGALALKLALGAWCLVIVCAVSLGMDVLALARLPSRHERAR